MTDLFEKSIQTLELPRVMELLAGQAQTEEGKDRCRALRPLTDADDVRRRLEETSAALGMIVLRGSPSLSGVRPVGASLQRADMGGALNTKELLDIAALLRCARAAREYASREGSAKTCIDHLFASLVPNRFLEEKISGAILSEEEIADAASPELADIRRHIRACSSKVRDILQKLISSSQSKYLQESIITMRSGRYVVPVRSECKNEIPGLVHDVSGSGGTFFIEPMGVVKTNNELRELQAREEKEIERILRELSAECAAHREDIAQNYDLLVLLDGIFARARLSSRLHCSAPRLAARGIDLKKARHPLLPPDKAVANDLRLGGDFDTLVITGPNTGGKTVTLKTMGLLILMAQCGLHIPVGDDSSIVIFDHVLADIGDEQSIAQNLSTFSSHMTNIVGILEACGPGSLILFDELGAGTDPVEGAALAAAVIESARKRGALVCATTHYAELKVYAMTTPGVENASCEFDVETLAPTYRLLIGIPGKSNAFAISKRLGLPQSIIDQAAARIDAENVRFEDVLTQLDRQRQEMEREKAVQKAQAEARAILDEARRTADQVFAELNDMRRRQEKEASWQEQNDRRAGLRRRLNEAEDALGGHEELPVPPSTRPAKVGDTVELVKMGTRATVLAVNKDGGLQLQAGILKITAKREEVRVVEDAGDGKKQAAHIAQRAEHKLRALGASPEVDLRGMMTDEALLVLDRFLDSAVMGRLETVTVIHGKGTGAVRKAVRDHLKRSRYVKSFRPGRYGEGEDGVTVVELK